MVKKSETVKRYALFIVGLFFSALRVALTKRAELGVSPISSIPNVLSLRFTDISMGNWLIIFNCLLIAGQIIILRKKFKPIQLLQVPLSFLFGWFTDFGVWLVGFIPVSNYGIRLLLVVFGVAVLGFGISLTVVADVIMNAGEAFVKVVADTVKKNFGNVKTVFDIICVSTSVLLSLLMFNMKIVGAREGTLIAALFTGTAVKLFTKVLRTPLESMLK